MNQSAVITAYACWVPLVALLFMWKGPRVGVPTALFAAFLVLPRVSLETVTPPFGGWINKLTVSGVALLVGILVSDSRTLLKARPRWYDLPMAAFVLLPLVSLAANEFDSPWDGLGLAWTNLTGWAIPYLAGRLYFGDRDGPRRLAKAVVVAGLLSIPLFAYEMAVGPGRYLAGFVYGIPPYDNMADRLGGWRPEGFLTSGLEVATWLALSATTAAWCWFRGAWPSRPSVAWLPPTALILTTVASRGVYGYVNLTVGLAVAIVTHLAGTRAALIALALVPPAYIGTRMTGAWDAQPLANAARAAGRAGTVEYRLRAENEYLTKLAEHDPILGFGGKNSEIYDFFAQRHLWPDGWWIHQLRNGGLVGLSAAMLALFLWPIGLAMTLPVDRSGRDAPAALAWGLALFVALHMLDCLHNMNYLTPTALIGGSLVGLSFARPRAGLERPSWAATSSVKDGLGPRWPVLVTATILIAIEILGRFPRTPGPSPLPQGPQASPAKNSK
jgi:hypothetical protein